MTRRVLAKFEGGVDDLGFPVLKMTALSINTFVGATLIKPAEWTYLNSGNRLVFSWNFAANEQSFEIVETGVDVAFEVVGENAEISAKQDLPAEEIYVDLRACFKPNPLRMIALDHYAENEEALLASRIRWPECVNARDSDGITHKRWVVFREIEDEGLPFTGILYYEFKMDKWEFVSSYFYDPNDA